MLTERVYIQQFDISAGLGADLYYLEFAQQTWA